MAASIASDSRSEVTLLEEAGTTTTLWASPHLRDPGRCSLGAVTQTTVYELGVPASCTDGFCGNVTHFVVDSATLVVTHLIVEPELRSRVGKLVPIRLVEAADDSVEIQCDLAAFDALADADEGMSNTLPSGHLAVRGDQHVHSTDGEIGKIRAVRVDAGRGRVTHILLQEGHLWGKREVAIPWGSVTGLDGGVHVNLTSEAIKELPAVLF